MTETAEEVEIRHLRADIEELRGRVGEMEKQDKRRMHLALALLGGVVMTLAGYIWASKDILLGLKK